MEKEEKHIWGKTDKRTLCKEQNERKMEAHEKEISMERMNQGRDRGIGQ